MKRKGLILALTLTICTMLSASTQEARLLRFPAVGGDRIVFSYAGDLYSVGMDGGVAVRLTSDPGYECFARISPDGQTIAFTGQYDGNTEVYTIPIDGGEPKRLTWSALVSRDQVGERMGPDNIVMGWTPDGEKIVYRSKQHNFSGLRGRLCLVDTDGGVPEVIPTTEGGFCSFSPDGTRLAMNRMFREFRTWKYYRGGQADDIWINRVGTTELTKITDNDAQDIFPMWIGDKIFFLSDRDRTMNLFSYDTVTGATEKLTHFSEYDCKFPSHSSEWIVFENGGYIYKYNALKGGEAEKLTIYLSSDDIWSRSEYRNMDGKLSDFSLSPDGSRVLATGRGDIFSLPASKGAVYNLSRSPQSHEREPRWSPDGKSIAWFSDASGEYQVYVAPADAPGEAKQMTDFDHGYPSRLSWSPDGSKLYFRTDERDIYELEVNSGKLERILSNEIMGFHNFTLSPDGNWAAYVEVQPNEIGVLYLYNTNTRESYPVTDRWYDAGSPLFSQDGKYLFFTSSQDFRANYSYLEWNATFRMADYIFVLPLAADTPNPVQNKSDEYSVATAEEGGNDGKSSKKGQKSDSKADAEATRTTVDIEGLQSRISVLPVEAGNYYLLAAANDKLYYRGGQLKVLDLKTLKSSDAPEGMYLDFTPDLSKVLVRAGGQYKVIPLGSSPATAEAVPTSDADMIVDHEAEWKQIYDESWRITRDGFYVENMHGVDWDSIRDKYAVMLPYVKHRDDLSYLIGEMIGELNVGHAYITSGETPEISRIPMGLLGASYSKDGDTGAFRIEKIFGGASWSESLRSPLTEAGVDVSVGDYILAVNGVPASALKDPGEVLVGKAGKTVALKVASSADGKDARTVYVRPVSDESQLAYHEWVKGNVEKVNELSGGRIGYIHIPDMGPEGLEMFARMYYSQLDKEALIIDDRMNGGGNVSPMILERLQREVYRISMGRNYMTRNVPDAAFYGPMVCLIDKYSSSDGDLFPYGFRRLGLGKIIGMRSWGGIVGISMSKSFVDGQDMRTPFFTSYSTEGEWIIEGHGVDPDIEVDINPFEDYLGKDAQLEKAVEVLLEELKDYKPLPGIPAAPVKNK